MRLRADACEARAGQHFRTVAARTAQALDELPEGLVHAERLTAEVQARLGEVYDFLPGQGDG